MYVHENRSSMSQSAKGGKCFSCPSKGAIVQNGKNCEYCGQTYHPSCYDRSIKQKILKCCDNGRGLSVDETHPQVQNNTNTMTPTSKRSAEMAGLNEESRVSALPADNSKKQRPDDRERAEDETAEEQNKYEEELYNKLDGSQRALLQLLEIKMKNSHVSKTEFDAKLLEVDTKVNKNAGEIAGCKQKITNMESKVKGIEDKISNEKRLEECENQVYEYADRQSRRKNVILYSFPEKNDRNEEMKEVIKLIGCHNCPYDVNKIFTVRIGKVQENTARPLKIVCGSEELAKWLFISRELICNNTSFNIKRDKTRQQRQYTRMQVEKLKLLNNGGEKFSIKYVKDRPTIVKNNKKNGEMAQTEQEMEFEEHQ